MIPRWFDAAKQVIQVKRKERQLPQMKGIEEVRPLRRVRYVGVIRDQDIVKMKWVIEGRREEQNACHNQASRDFQRIWIVAQLHVVCVIVANRLYRSMRVAVVHDWLNGMRGGEKVLEAILEIYPDAALYTLFHEPGKVSPHIESHRITTSWLNKIPGIYRHYRNLLPLFPPAVGAWDLSGFDLVISSSHAVAKDVFTGSATHICYCHTPMRYIWDARDDYAFGPL